MDFHYLQTNSAHANLLEMILDYKFNACAIWCFERQKRKIEKVDII